MEDVFPGKTDKMLNISDIIYPIFISISPIWSHCVWPSNSCNTWPWKFLLRSKFTKMLIFYMRIRTSNVKSLIGSQKFQRVTEFSIITTNNHHHCFQKHCSVYTLLQIGWKTKKCDGLQRLLHIVKNVYKYMIEVLGIYNTNLWGDSGLPNNSVFFFQVENGLHEKEWKHRISLVPRNRFSLFFFTMCLRK